MNVSKLIQAIAWFLFTLLLLCLPGSDVPKFPWMAVIYADKWAHIFIFFVLCFLFNRYLLSTQKTNVWLANCFLLVALAGTAYGTAMEFVQKYWIPNRSFEIADILSDLLGCIVAYVLAMKQIRRG